MESLTITEDVPSPRSLVRTSRATGPRRFLFLAAAGLLAAGCVDLGAPDWSPDERRIVYTRLVGRSPEVRLLDLDSGEPPKLLVTNAFRARWSVDGARVFFIAIEGTDENARMVLRSCAADGTGQADHAPGAAGGIGWYALDPSGKALYYMRDDTGGLYRLDFGTGRAARVLEDRARCTAAALDPSGRLLAYAVEGKGKKGERVLELRTFDLQAKTDRKLDASLPAGDGDDASAPVLVFLPSGRELAVMASPVEEVAIVQLPRGRVRKLKVARRGGLVLASAPPGEKNLYLTVASRDGPFISQRIDLATGKATVLAEGTDLTGGRSRAPGGGAFAELTPMGLKVSTADGRWAKHYPVGFGEYRLLAGEKIRAGDPGMALALVKEALERAGRGADVQELMLVESDARLAIGERDQAARAFLQAYLMHPVSDVKPADVERRATVLRADDRLVDTIHRALRKNAGPRARTLTGALPLSADARELAGINFRIGEAHLAAGDAQDAGKRFRLASDTADFPAADYAAGIAALSYYVAGRDKYAAELLLKAIDLFPGSPLQNDLRAALKVVRDRRYAALKRSQDVTHPSGTAAWTRTRTVRDVRWSLGPTLEGGRRLLVETRARSSLFVARPDERGRPVLADLRVELRHLAFSLDGRRLAFAAYGGGGGSAAYVIDLAGRVLVGNAPALSSGDVPGGLPGGLRGGLRGGETITGLAWDPTGRSIVVTVARPTGGEVARRIAVPPPRAPTPRRPLPVRRPFVPAN